MNNGMTWSPKEAANRSHLRLVTAIVWFVHPYHRTLGHLADDPVVQELWSDYQLNEPVIHGMSRATWMTEVAQALHLLRHRLRDVAAAMCCEIQCALRLHRDAKLIIHKLYKGVRPDKAQSFFADFAKHRPTTREMEMVETAFQRACKEGSVQAVCRALGLQPLPPPTTTVITSGSSLVSDDDSSDSVFSVALEHEELSLSIENVSRGLCLAAAYAHRHCVECILYRYHNLQHPQAPMLDIPAALEHACEGGDERCHPSLDVDRKAIVEALFQRFNQDDDASAIRSTLTRALHAAVKNGFAKIVEFFLRQITAPVHYASLLLLAVTNYHTDTAAVLLRNCSTNAIIVAPAAAMAAQQNDIASLRLLLENGDRAMVTNDPTVLSSAAHCNNTETMLMLLQSGAPCNPLQTPVTPLFAAAACVGESDGLRLLLASKASLDSAVSL